MTYDRKYNWTKGFEEEISNVSKKFGFLILKSDIVNVDNIKLSKERTIKINIQKALSRIGLMNYGEEFGQTIILKSENTDQILKCKAWCLGDHIMGIEIEYGKFGSYPLNNIKQEFQKKFVNYKIIWTEIVD